MIAKARKRGMQCVAVFLALMPLTLFAETPHSRMPTVIVSELSKIARERPCTVVAAVQALQSNGGKKNGVLYLDTVPSPEKVRAVLDGAERGASADSAGLQMNPYSGSQYLVEVSWSIDAAQSGSLTVAIHSQLVSRAQAALKPPHLVEPRAILVLSERGVMLLPDSKLVL